MKKYYSLLIFVLIFSANSKIFSQDTNSAKYFPLNVGNVWYYKTTFTIPYPPIFSKEYIVKDTVINNHRYFYYLVFYNIQVISSELIRIDSANGNLLVYSPGNGCGSYTDDKIIDSLASIPPNQIICDYQNLILRKCHSLSTESVFGIISDTKEFYHDGNVIENKTYAKNFGVIHFCSGEPPPCSSFTDLIGCKINGIVYGDTIMTSVQQTGYSIPEKFFLSQNYPNPFNPSTVINYELRITGYVSLKVYDAVGKEVATLVNEIQNAGSYNYQFSTVNYQLPSGIYFYELKTENFSKIKKMILLK